MNGIVHRSVRNFEFEAVRAAQFAGVQSQSFEILQRKGGASKYLVKWMAASSDVRQRAEALIGIDLRHVPSLVLPRDLIANKGQLGIVSPMVDAAMTLEDKLVNDPPTVRTRVMYALQMAYAVAVAERCGLRHGDQHGQNWLAGSLYAYLIDWENCSGPGLPLATLAGGEYSAAPERFRAGHQPDWASEAYSLAASLHEVLLGFNHLENTLGLTTEQVREKPWLHDPALGASGSGLPVEYLHPTLVNAFRLTLTPDAARRVPAERWWEALRRLVHEGRLAQCAKCGQTLHLHSARASCPYCTCAFQRAVITETGKRLPVHDRLQLGRRELGGDAAVGNPHVRLWRKGAELFVEMVGGTETLMYDNGDWHRVVPGVATRLPTASALRLGGTVDLVVE